MRKVLQIVGQFIGVLLFDGQNGFDQVTGRRVIHAEVARLGENPGDKLLPAKCVRTDDVEKNGPRMTGSFALLKQRRFLPLFVTQLLGAFNDNLFKNAMVLFVVYGVFNDEASETLFSAVATGVFILPFFLLSAISGQIADSIDKTRVIRWVKTAEIAIMLVGAAGQAQPAA